MKILYIDCNSEFSADMLLGAMLDMGASKCYIQNMLKDAGFDAQVVNDSVRRHGMEAQYAYCKCESALQSIQIPNNIKDVFVKDFGKNCDCIEELCGVVAACYGVKCFLPDYIMCSKVTGTSDIQKEFLRCIVNEEGCAPSGNIICAGYGAGENDVLRAVLYLSESDLEFAEQNNAVYSCSQQ